MTRSQKMDVNVALVVVTYNRSSLLPRCIDALLMQKDQFKTLFVIDNNSSDGTQSLFTEGGKYVNEACISYNRMSENVGGAGGFHEGLRLSFEDHQFAILMDDDGYSDSGMISNLVTTAITNELHFANALVVDEDNHDILAFRVAREGNVEKVKNMSKDNMILGSVNPFNGTLISKDLFDKIGNIKKEMFIWGDEVEYRLRTLKAGFKVGTVVNAIHYHPSTKTFRQDVFGIKIEEKKGDISHVFYRNQAYKISEYENKKNFIWFLFRYSLHIVVNKRSFSKLRMFWAYAMDGAKDKYELPALQRINI